MIHRCLLSPLFILLLSIPQFYGTGPCVRAQNFHERYYDGGADERGSSVVMRGNRLLLAGTTDDAPDRFKNQFYVLDTDGLPLNGWEPDTNRRTAGGNVVVTNNGFLASAVINTVGTTDNNLLLTFDPEGNPTGAASSGALLEDEQIQGLIQAPNNQALAFGNIGTSNEALIYLLNADGSPVWRRRFTLPGNRFTVMTSAVATNDGFILAGYATPDQVTSTSLLVKISPAGELIWSYEMSIPGERDETRRIVRQLPEGGLLVSVNVRENSGRQTVRLVQLSNGQGGPTVTSVAQVGVGENVSVFDMHLTGEGMICVGTATFTEGVPRATAFMYLTDGEVGNVTTFASSGRGRIVDVSPGPGGGVYLVGDAENCYTNGIDVLLAYAGPDLENPLIGCQGEVTTISRSSGQLPALISGGELTMVNEQELSVPETVSFNTDHEAPFCGRVDLDTEDDGSVGDSYDYRPAPSCYTRFRLIAETDAAFFPDSGEPDSIVINFPGANEEEFLTRSNSTDAWFNDRGNGRYVLIRPADGGPGLNFRTVLRLIAYVNQQAVVTSGSRLIEVTLFSCGIASLPSFSEINLLGETAAILSDTIVCPGTELLLDATQPDALAYQWDQGAAAGDSPAELRDAVLGITEAGTYTVTVTGACNEAIDTVVVTAGDAEILPPVIPQQPLCVGDSAMIDVTTAGANRYVWSDGVTGPVRTISTAGSFVATISNACFAEETAFNVTVTSCCEVYRPNAFSPNGDGVNDVFSPAPAGCNLLSGWLLRIYNRWGGEVFASADPAVGWDGRKDATEACTPGVYVYVLEYFDGLEGQLATGSVSLLR